MSQITVLITIIYQAERIGNVLTLLQLIGSSNEQTVRSYVGSITSLVVIYCIDRVTIVVVSRCYLVTDTLGIRLSRLQRVRCIQVQTEVERLVQLEAQRSVVSLCTSILQYVSTLAVIG